MQTILIRLLALLLLCGAAHAQVVRPQNGGTGIQNNVANTVTYTGNYAQAVTLTGATNITLPVSGTVLSDATTPTLPSPTLNNIIYWSNVTAPGTFSNASIGTGLSLSGGILSATGGYATSVWASLPAATGNAGTIYQVTDVGPASAGTLWGSDGAVYRPVNGHAVLFRTGIPLFINGAVTFNTAGAMSSMNTMPIFTASYGYFGANIINSTGSCSTAGWYYVVMATATTGTVYTTKYDPTTGVPPTIPAAPAACTSAAASQTQTPSTITVFQVPVKGGVLGTDGRLHNDFSTGNTNSANNKTLAISLGGTAIINRVATTSTYSAPYIDVINMDATHQRNLYVSGSGAGIPGWSITEDSTIYNINTASDQNWLITATLANSADYMSVKNFMLEVIK